MKEDISTNIDSPSLSLIKKIATDVNLEMQPQTGAFSMKSLPRIVILSKIQKIIAISQFESIGLS